MTPWSDLPEAERKRLHKNEVSIDILRELLDYDPETGSLTWRYRSIRFFSDQHYCDSWNSKHAGRPAFTADSGYGYRVGRIFDRLYRAHRVAFALYHGRWPADQVDHIDGDRSQNRISNLRDVSNSTNGKNTKRRNDNVSGEMGVSWCRNRGLWRAYITVDGKQKHLGRFTLKSDAIAARKAALKENDFHPNHGRSQ